MAAFPQLDYDDSDSELYRTNAYSAGTDADIDNTVPVDSEDGYTSDIDLTVKLGARIDFEFIAIGAGDTDQLKLRLFARRDSSWDGDELYIDEVFVPNDGTEDIYSYVIDTNDYGPGHFRFSIQSESGTDEFDIIVIQRQWRYEIAEV